MNCIECGDKLKKADKVCPKCGHERVESVKASESKVEEKTVSFEETIEEKHKKYQEYGADTNIILGIIELICCGGVFGLLAILLNEFMLKKALDSNDFAGARQANIIIRVILILGVVLCFLATIFYIFLMLVIG